MLRENILHHSACCSIRSYSSVCLRHVNQQYAHSTKSSSVTEKRQWSSFTSHDTNTHKTGQITALPRRCLILRTTRTSWQLSLRLAINSTSPLSFSATSRNRLPMAPAWPPIPRTSDASRLLTCARTVANRVYRIFLRRSWPTSRRQSRHTCQIQRLQTFPKSSPLSLLPFEMRAMQRAPTSRRSSTTKTSWWKTALRNSGKIYWTLWRTSSNRTWQKTPSGRSLRWFLIWCNILERDSNLWPKALDRTREDLNQWMSTSRITKVMGFRIKGQFTQLLRSFRF